MSPKNNEKYTKNFGFLLSAILFAISIYPLINDKNVNIVVLIFAIIALIITIFFHSLMQKPAQLWFLLGKLLHKIISPIIMLIVYITSIVFVALLMKIFRRDALEKKLDPKIKSYWVKRKNPIKDNFNLNDQF